MASTSSESNPKMISTIKINSPNVSNLVFETPIPSSVFEVGDDRPIFRLGPADPEDLSELLEKVTITGEGFFKSYVKMVDNLGTDGYVDLAMEIGEQFSEHGFLHPVVTLTGIIMHTNGALISTMTGQDVEHAYK